MDLQQHITSYNRAMAWMAIGMFSSDFIILLVLAGSYGFLGGQALFNLGFLIVALLFCGKFALYVCIQLKFVSLEHLQRLVEQGASAHILPSTTSYARLLGALAATTFLFVGVAAATLLLTTSDAWLHLLIALCAFLFLAPVGIGALNAYRAFKAARSLIQQISLCQS